MLKTCPVIQIEEYTRSSRVAHSPVQRFVWRISVIYLGALPSCWQTNTLLVWSLRNLTIKWALEWTGVLNAFIVTLAWGKPSRISSRGPDGIDLVQWHVAHVHRTGYQITTSSSVTQAHSAAITSYMVGVYLMMNFIVTNAWSQKAKTSHMSH